MKKKQSTLLPAGFRDAVFGEAETQTEIVYQLLKKFSKAGYRQVSPPMIEFERSLFSGAGAQMKSQSFRLLDPNSKNMMALRADMTLQIARIATSRLADEPRPLKLSYAGEVFRVQGEGLYADRSITQAGVELIGSSTEESDLEILSLAIASITSLNIHDISIDISMPSMVTLLIENETKKNQTKILSALAKRDYKTLSTLSESGALIKILAESAGPAEAALKKLTALSLPKNALWLKEKLKKLEQLISKISRKYPNLNLTVDPLEYRGFEYHKGFAFTIFSNEKALELARGGRYVIANGKDEIPSTGFTLLINNILRVLPE